MRPTRLIATLGAAVLVSFAGCGGADETAPPVGQEGAASGDAKATFTTLCGGCHTLAAADTNGRIGPDLDDERPSADEVVSAIERGPGSMPANLLTGADARSVAEYVASVAGS